jgi:hypothetical protein
MILLKILLLGHRRAPDGHYRSVFGFARRRFALLDAPAVVAIPVRINILVLEE